MAQQSCLEAAALLRIPPFLCSQHSSCAWLVHDSPAPVPDVSSVRCWGKRGVGDRNTAVCVRSLPEAVAPLSAPPESRAWRVPTQVPPPLRTRITEETRQRGGAGPRPPPRVSRRAGSLRPAAAREWAGVPPVPTARRGQQRAPCRPACSCSRSGVSKLGHTGRGGRGRAEGGLPARCCHRRGAAGSARGLRQHRRCDWRLAGTRR